MASFYEDDKHNVLVCFLFFLLVSVQSETPDLNPFLNLKFALRILIKELIDEW